MKTYARLLGLAGMLLFGGYAVAGVVSYSFSGNFTYDTDVQFFTFTITDGSAATGASIRTWSDAGGTNAAGHVIAGGGFEPRLSFFEANGMEMNPGFITNCTDPNLNLTLNPDTWSCDILYPNQYSPAAFPVGTWVPGTYTMALSLDANPAAGPDLSAGFMAASWGYDIPSNFVCAQYSPGFPATDPFCSTFNPIVQLDGHWALDIINVDSAQMLDTGVPEPGTLSFALLGVAAFVTAYRRRRPTA